MNRPVMPERFYLYDSTLRDGARQEGLQLSVDDKLRIAGYLDDLGVHFIEAGSPGVNDADTDFFQRAMSELALGTSKLVAVGGLRKAGVDAADDPAVTALLDAGTEWVSLVVQAHEGHVSQLLRTSLDENLAMIIDTVGYLTDSGRHVIVNCEHYFDAFRQNPAYALEVVRTAAEAGAEVVVLCDTNGGMLPTWMGDIVSRTAAIGVDLGINCRNDSGCAVANSLAAVEAGVVMIQGTINGYGERAGGTDLTTVIANAQLKFGWPVLAAEQLERLTTTSHAVADIVNQPQLSRQPYVGSAAFTSRVGRAAAGLGRRPLGQHVDPAVVGNEPRVLLADAAERTNILLKGGQQGFDLTDRELASQITDVVAERESRGYSYEAADASFMLLVLDFLDRLQRPFLPVSWEVFTRIHKDDQAGSGSEARVVLSIAGQEHSETGTGNGPMNALGQALTKALQPCFPQVAGYRLTDYRVRILDDGKGTDASVRVLIDTSDGVDSWTTVGVGTNLIEASWEALSDAYLYGIIRGERVAAEPRSTVRMSLVGA